MIGLKFKKKTTVMGRCTGGVGSRSVGCALIRNETVRRNRTARLTL